MLYRGGYAAWRMIEAIIGQESGIDFHRGYGR